MPDTHSYKRELTPAVLVYCGWLLLVALAASLVHHRAWGFNLLGFARTEVTIGFAIAAFAGLIVIIVPSVRLPMPHLRPSVGIILMAVGTLVVAWLLHAREAYLGDGTMRAMDTGKGIGYIPSELLPSFLAGAIASTLPVEPSASGYWALRVLSIGSGVGLVIGLWYFIPRAFGDTQRALIFWILSMGSVRLFAGYIESYALPFALYTLWTVAAIGCYKGRMGPGWMTGLLIACILSHVTAAVLLPATLWLLARDRAGRINLKRSAFWIYGAVATAVVTAVLVAFYLKQVSLPGVAKAHFFVTLASQPPHNYGLLSVDHLYDFINHWLLLAPAFVVAGTAYLILRVARYRSLRATEAKRESGRHQATNVFWMLAGVTPLIAGFVVDPKLGWARDWDLFALFSAPALVAIALWLNSLRGPVGRTACVVAVLSSGLWLSFSVDGRAEQRRFEALLELDPSRSDYGHEIMAQQYRRVGDHQGMLRHYRAALAVNENHRYRMNIAASYYYLKHFDEAERWYRGVVERDSTNAAAYHGLSLALTELGRFEEAVTTAAAAAAREPQNASYGFRLGSALLDVQRYSEALPYLLACQRSSPSDPAVANALAACLLGLGQLDEAKAAIDSALRLQPEAGIVWLNAARISFQRGEFDMTAKYLQEYQMRVAPEHRHAEVQLLLDSLAHIPDTSP